MADVETIDDVLSAAAAEIALKGVAKTGRNAQQGYNFRGIDDVLNAVGPVLAKKGISVTAKFSDRSVERIQSKNGGTLFNISLTGEFTYWWRDQHRTTVTIGEAMDSGDKATNKAMAMAAKYAHILTFSIPLVGSDDADLRAHAAGSNGADVPASSRLDALEETISDDRAEPPAAPPAGNASPPTDAPAGPKSNGGIGVGLTLADEDGIARKAYPATGKGARDYLAAIEANLKSFGPEDAKRFFAANKSTVEKLRMSKDAGISGHAVSIIDHVAMLGKTSIEDLAGDNED